MNINLILFSSLLISTFSCQSNQTITTTQGDVGNKFTIIDSEIDQLVWCKSNPKIILALTINQNLYRSIDKGYTWVKVQNQLNRQGYLELETDNEQVGKVKSIIVSESDTDRMILQGTASINWKTNDCGKTFTAMNQGRNVHEFQFHPTEPDWLLAAAWSICNDYDSDQPCKIIKELFLSTDFGEKWVQIEDYVVQFSWALIYQHFLVPKERILVALDPDGQGHQKTKGWNENVHLMYSDNFFNTSTKVLSKGNKFKLSKKYLFAVQVINEKSQDVQLMVSKAHRFDYKFEKVELPFNHLKDFSYNVIDDSGHQVMLSVNHNGQNSKVANLYISNSQGSIYSLSLQNNIRQSDGECDFEKIQSLEGVYMANVYEQKMVSQNKKNIENYKQTVISYNRGATWHPIAVPEKNEKGQKIDCQEQSCQLHLHSISNNQFGPFYSTPNSVGIIIGTGNIGQYLSNKASQINTYLSRDGGLSFQEILSGSHIYEVGDHGSLLLAVNDQSPTSDAVFSFDEGLTMYDIEFAPFKVDASNIVQQPGNKAEYFIIYGTVESKGFISVLDFDKLHTRQCQKSDDVDVIYLYLDSDYEVWHAKDTKLGQCFMGRKISYIRKKQQSQCFNGMDYEPKQITQLCECSEEDWECDIGFSRVGNGPCKPNGRNITANIENKCEYGMIQVTKIPDNYCFGGVNHSPISISCSYVPVSYQSVFILLIVMIIIFILANSNFPNLVKQHISKKKQEYKEFQTSREHRDEEADNRLFEDD